MIPTTGQPLPPPASPPAPATPAPSRPPRLVTRRRVLTGAGGVAVAAATGGAVALSSAGTGGGPSPSSGRSASTAGAGAVPSPVPAGTGEGILVLVTCYGGNDGLNTVIPISDPAYAAARPTLGYGPSEVLPLSDGLALNAKLPGLAGRWRAGQLAIVRGVGYPDPSLSHFQSMDIWQTASLGGSGDGWLGRWLDATGHDPLRAISFGATLPPALRGQLSAATALTSDSITLPGRAPMMAAYAACSHPGHDRSSLAASSASTDADLLSVRSSLASLTGSPSLATASATPTGSSGLVEAMGDVVTLINAGSPTKVYQVSLSSFDTHADEKAGQERLLAELDDGITTLLDGVARGPRAGDVVAATVSEFGRRPAQNASGGTDHGTAAPVFVVGHGVKGGFVGDEPSLTALDPNGNLVFTTDFRSVYATLLDRVVGFDPRAVLGAAFPQLPLV